MTPEVIADILALLERVQLTWREVPSFNRAVGALLIEKDKFDKKLEESKP